MNDIQDPSFAEIFTLSLLRCLRSAGLTVDASTPFVYPAGHTIRGNEYSNEDYRAYGNLAFEYERLLYTFSTYSCRGIPLDMFKQITLLLSQTSVLNVWKQFVPELRHIAVELANRSARVMSSSAHPSSSKSRHTVVPDYYETSDTSGKLAIELLERTLLEAGPALITEFHTLETSQVLLEIFLFLRDPVGGLHRDVKSASIMFFKLFNQVHGAMNQVTASECTLWPHLLSQLAAEACYLATPYVASATYIHFHRHQQLLYSYVAIGSLSRSEFSDASHVLEIIQEILENGQKSGGICGIAPVAIALYPEIPPDCGEKSKMMRVIIDGNHRVTAIAFLRLMAAYPAQYRPQLTVEHVRSYSARHHVGQKWLLELEAVMAALLRKSRHDSAIWRCLQENSSLVSSFNVIENIPALIVEEELFHTVDEQTSTQVYTQLLLPMHQAIYNHSKRRIALPQAGQRHGRPESFRLMPLTGMSLTTNARLSVKFPWGGHMQCSERDSFA
ncbi:hypothetical protein PWT90_06164 [Aphanocladium album]|nr:hypothetical protein PWT90_06164 [Aphanocladium album]